MLAAGVVAGMVALWPDASPAVDPGPPLETAVVRAVDVLTGGEPDPLVGGSGDTLVLDLEITSGAEAGTTATIEVPPEGYPPFAPGDEVKVRRPDRSAPWSVVDFVRLPALVWLLAGFVLAVVVVGRWTGVRSLIGLVVSLLVVTRFIVPSILSGNDPAAVALVGALAVMLVSLYVTHGVTPMTTAATVGTAAALAVTIVVGLVAIDRAALTGFTADEARLARFALGELDLRGLVLAGLIIATLGVLDDVTVTQASTVFALRDVDPSRSWRDLVVGAMRVGRDHIASTVNTLFLAYAGASVALLVLFALGGSTVGEIVNAERFAEEVVQTVVGSIGLILAVPLTTALAAVLATHAPTPAPDAPLAPDDDDDDAVVAGSDDEDHAYDAWVRYLRDGGGHIPPAPDDER